MVIRSECKHHNYVGNLFVLNRISINQWDLRTKSSALQKSPDKSKWLLRVCLFNSALWNMNETFNVKCSVDADFRKFFVQSHTNAGNKWLAHQIPKVKLDHNRMNFAFYWMALGVSCEKWEKVTKSWFDFLSQIKQKQRKQQKKKMKYRRILQFIIIFYFCVVEWHIILINYHGLHKIFVFKSMFCIHAHAKIQSQ